jgi:sugar/nucleoside kinase (ribokinase family)
LHVLDVNLRGDFYNPETLRASLTRADVVKLNEGELRRIHELLPDALRIGGAIDDLAFNLVEVFDLKLASVTRGPRGTVIYTRERRLEAEPAVYPRSPQADAVGAGDASCAGLVYGLLAGWSLERTLRLSNILGGYVASQPGGSSPLPSSVLDEVRSA